VSKREVTHRIMCIAFVSVELAAAILVNPPAALAARIRIRIRTRTCGRGSTFLGVWGGGWTGLCPQIVRTPSSGRRISFCGIDALHGMETAHTLTKCHLSGFCRKQWAL
jgi:hypothetical protein